MQSSINPPGTAIGQLLEGPHDAIGVPQAHPNKRPVTTTAIAYIYVGLGAFNYFSGTLPSMIKPFAWLFGAHGDKDVGIEQLQTAMQKSRYSKTEARIVYYSALLANKEYASAFPILEKLMADVPPDMLKDLPPDVDAFVKRHQPQD